MRNYFTTIEKTDNMFVGTVQDNDTKETIFRTVAHPSHGLAIIDTNKFLQSLTENQTPVSQTIVNTATYQQTAPEPQPEPPRRCCGR